MNSKRFQVLSRELNRTDLYESSTANLRVELLEVTRKVNIEEEIIAAFLQQRQTSRVLRFVEGKDNLPDVRLQFEEEFERTGKRKTT